MFVLHRSAAAFTTSSWHACKSGVLPRACMLLCFGICAHNCGESQLQALSLAMSGDLVLQHCSVLCQQCSIGMQVFVKDLQRLETSFTCYYDSRSSMHQQTAAQSMFQALPDFGVAVASVPGPSAPAIAQVCGCLHLSARTIGKHVRCCLCKADRGRGQGQANATSCIGTAVVQNSYQSGAARMATLHVQDVRAFCQDAVSGSVLVMVSGVADHHAACAAARTQGVMVERIFGTCAPTRVIEPSRANWCCTLAELLAHHGQVDWRSVARDGSTILFNADLARSAAPLLAWPA